jgi:hypothetical protein
VYLENNLEINSDTCKIPSRDILRGQDFLGPLIVQGAARDNLGVQKVEALSKCPEKLPIK